MTLMDLHPQPTDVLDEVVAGLGESPKLLPCKLLYDKRGSELFDAICELPEYYPTRTEMAIMREHADAMCDAIGEGALLIELGSGSSLKTRLLLEHMRQPAGYVPIDISREHLLQSAAALKSEFPHLPIMPVCADYSQPLDLPEPSGQVQRRVIYFPGSTIGNFHPPAASQFLGRMRGLAGSGGAMLIGVDLRKSPDILVPAYDDAQGVTAAFNLNLLARLRRDGLVDVELDAFAHRAVWNDRASRIEMHLVARCDTRLGVGSQTFTMHEGEYIRSECSYKHTLEAFSQIARPWRVQQVWTDPNAWFSIQYLV